MNTPEEPRAWFTNLVEHPLFSQITPFIVLFLFPLIALVCFQTVKGFSFGTTSFIMVLENLGSFFPWNWGGSQSNAVSSRHETKKLKKKHVLTRSEQLEMNGYARPGAPSPQLSNSGLDLLVQILDKNWLKVIIPASSTFQAHTAS
jgi:hypothetical protein